MSKQALAIKTNKKATLAEKAHAIRTAVTTVVAAAFITLNKVGRAHIQSAFGYGVDAFNTYVGDKNICVRLLNLALKYYADVQQWLLIEEASGFAFYVTEGNSGLHGGVCETFNFEIEDETLRVLRHPNGAWIFADGVKGLRVVTESELIAIAAKADDFRKFVVTEQESGKTHLYSGALIGDMKLKRQALVVRTKDGLAVVSLTTGKIGIDEKADRAVEAGALSDADKATLRSQIFGGILAERTKKDANNAKRRERKALRK